MRSIPLSASNHMELHYNKVRSEMGLDEGDGLACCLLRSKMKRRKMECRYRCSTEKKPWAVHFSSSSSTWSVSTASGLNCLKSNEYVFEACLSVSETVC